MFRNDLIAESGDAGTGSVISLSSPSIAEKGKPHRADAKAH
eukprot:SAG31_NODE_14757_length_789_cov_0.866667_1_plen_40_part_10